MASVYPSFFADTSLKGQQLFAVTRMLKDFDGFTKWHFFVGGKGSLGGSTPLAALREGKLWQVKVTAEAYAERCMATAGITTERPSRTVDLHGFSLPEPLEFVRKEDPNWIGGAQVRRSDDHHEKAGNVEGKVRLEVAHAPLLVSVGST